jgi:hypothetical protein
MSRQRDIERDGAFLGQLRSGAIVYGGRSHQSRLRCGGAFVVASWKNFSQ